VEIEDGVEVAAAIYVDAVSKLMKKYGNCNSYSVIICGIYLLLSSLPSI